MKVVEGGDIASAITYDLYADLCAAVEAKSGWLDCDIAETVKDALFAALRKRLPERGFIITATKEEIMGVDIKAFSHDIEISVKKESELKQ